jgi:hypothetical protein
VRENGGQYTHAAVWAVMALARSGRGDEASEMFHMLNPANHTRTPADVERYGAEPFVMAGDVYADADHTGARRVELVHGLRRLDVPRGLALLGLERRGTVFSMDPCVPSSWPGFEIRWRFGSALYTITVENHGQRGRGRGHRDARRTDRRPARDPPGGRRPAARGADRPGWTGGRAPRAGGGADGVALRATRDRGGGAGRPCGRSGRRPAARRCGR